MQPDFYSFLKNRLKNPLPGLTSQLKMAAKPADKDARTRKTTAPADAHPSSVLILLFPDTGQNLKLLLTQRTQNINHGGEISLPGGRAEAGETVIGTALRETREEVGIRSDKIKIMGQLSDLYVEHSRNNVRTVVGFLSHEPVIKANPEEVEEAFFVSLNTLLDEDKLVVEKWCLHGVLYNVPYWNVHRVPLWGATAMILSELIDLYKELICF